VKTIRRIIVISLFSYTAAGIALFFMQTQMIYLPDDRKLADCSLPEGVEFWQQGEEHGLLGADGNANLLVFFHGNADMACDWRYLGVNHLNPLGYDVLVVEYPGYGGDGRKPSKLLIEGTIDTSYNWVAQQDYDKIVVMGYSLGTGAAAIYADRYGADQVILFAPFDSIYNVARGQGMVYPRALLTEDFDNIASLATVDADISILHGQDDKVIPASHSARLAIELQAMGRSVNRVVLTGLGHQDLFTGPIFDMFLQDVLPSGSGR